jgi:colicin import membrane protein
MQSALPQAGWPAAGRAWPGRSSWLLSAAVHGLLLLALALGVRWQRSEPTVVEAELWAALPQQAAPMPRPALEPAPNPTPPPAPPPERQPDIVTAKTAEPPRKPAPAQRPQPEPPPKERLATKPLERPAPEPPKPKPPTQTAVDDSKRLAAERAKEMDRLMALSQVDPSTRAGGIKATEALTGTAPSAAGAPSAGYAGRIVARIRPNIVFPERDTTPGNPAALVEIRTSPDGTIIARRIKQGSGNKAWDDAVIRAIDKAEVLPRDTDGRVPPVLEITFRVRD